MTIAPFNSETKLISFAKLFFKDRIGSFRKDVRICLTADAKRHHAYFPALINCITFLDMLSGLHAGKLDGHGFADLENYVTRFMDVSVYTPLRLRVLYYAFRHKIAHLSVPYVVFDTSTRKEFANEKPRRITWIVYAGKRPLPIELVDYSHPQQIRKAKRPWSLSYNCRAHISVPRFRIDIVRSIYGKTGYLAHLKSDLGAKEHFAKCMKVLFPPG